MRRSFVLETVACLAYLLASTAQADFYDGMRAFDQKSYSIAVKEWKSAAKADNDMRSIMKLAELYEQGLGVPANPIAAHALNNIGASLGSDVAKRNRSRIEGTLTKEEVLEAQDLALRLFSEQRFHPELLDKRTTHSAGVAPACAGPDGNTDPRLPHEVLVQLGYVASRNDRPDDASYKEGVKRFQKTKELMQDGELNELTLAAICAPPVVLEALERARGGAEVARSVSNEDTSRKLVKLEADLAASDARLKRLNAELSSLAKEAEEARRGAAAAGRQLAKVQSAPPPFTAKYACDLSLDWQDRGSGGKRDVALFRASATDDAYQIGGYAQSGYDQASGCVLKLSVPEANRKLVSRPARWVEVWRDTNSGAEMDGSIWRAEPPSSDYVCIGDVGQTGYSPPSVPGYVCVHECATVPGEKAPSLWDTENVGSSKVLFSSGTVAPVAIRLLPRSNSFFADSGSSGARRDINLAARCSDVLE